MVIQSNNTLLTSNKRRLREPNHLLDLKKKSSITTLLSFAADAKLYEEKIIDALSIAYELTNELKVTCENL
jgi:hypothetical protein